MQIEKIQEQRGRDYGEFTNHIFAVDSIMKILKDQFLKHNITEYPKGFDSALFYMVSKLVRLATSPLHKDSALDLSSYADLWLKEINKIENKGKK